MENNTMHQSDEKLLEQTTTEEISLERPKKIRLRKIHTEIFYHLHHVFCKESQIEKIIHPANNDKRCIIEYTYIIFRPTMARLYISNVTDHVTYESAIYLSYVPPDATNVYSFRESCFTTITFVFSPTPYGDKEKDLNGEFITTWHIPKSMTNSSGTLSTKERQTLFQKRNQIINNLLSQQHQWCKPPET